ncbi:hypothetical protein RN001_009526 [Aquatica leii]|uniref:DUF4806 domain-containing protein n=1 Tax=Aquatica leii TaxID=1421715 RepID=A0AAN7SPZ3_9COLE|nr:hypothetical protein RN001_009526 [Aquatica leii]
MIGNILSGAGDLYDFQTEVLKTLQYNKYGIKDLRKKLEDIENILLQKRYVGDVSVKLDQKIYDKLPLKTDDDVGEIEILLENEENMTLLVHMLSLVGGSSMESAILLMFRKLLVKELAVTYSGAGKRGKKSFKILRIYSCIQRAVRKRFPLASETEIFKRCSSILATSGDGGRRQRDQSNNKVSRAATALQKGNVITESEFTTLLKLIINIQKQNDQILKLLEDQKKVHFFNYSKPLIAENLPLKTLDDFSKIEDITTSWDFSDKQAFILHLQSLGGQVLVTKVNNILRHIFTDNLACRFNFYGKGNKLPLRNTKIVDIIIDAVLSSGSSATRKEVEDSIKVWLKGAPQRVRNAELKETKCLS